MTTIEGSEMSEVTGFVFYSNNETRVFILQCLQNKVITLEEARHLLFTEK